MLIGPVFSREVATIPRRPRFYLFRTVYVASLFMLMCTAWLVLAGTQVIRNVGDMARFGTILFQILAPLQLSLVLFLSALAAASAVSQEKDKKTLTLLLLTRMTNSELVLGKLLSSLLNVMVMLAAALPLFMLTMLFGGVSVVQVVRIYAVTLATVLAAGSLGSTLAFWREKTFQTLALTAVTIVVWLAIWEVVSAGFFGSEILGISSETWATGGSPMRAILAAIRPIPAVDLTLGPIRTGVNLFLVMSFSTAVFLNGIAIAKIRVWNPTREIRPLVREDGSQESIWGAEYDLAHEGALEAADAARLRHVDARSPSKTVTSQATRRVWDNPIIWREVRTWAYGRKIILIRMVYLLLFGIAAGGLYSFFLAESITNESNAGNTAIPPAAQPLVPFFLVSLVIVNALAVTSITNERDGRALDLLLVTDLSPKEFIFGKLGGVFWVTKEMVVAPMVLCMALWWAGGVSLEGLVYLLGGLVVMNIFVAMLGIHYGMSYANSRTAISLSLCTVFFLFLGVATCIVMLISLSGSFQGQWGAFLAFIVGGSLGLFVALGVRNPSKAIFLASALVPFFTFYAIVSFLLDGTLSVFLVTCVTYGFTTAALLIPALFNFDFAMGRTTTPEQ